jgi:hypothetical protein
VEGCCKEKDLSFGDKCLVYLPDALIPECDDMRFLESSNWRVKMRRFKGAPSEVVIMPLSLREWSCPKCKTHHDRDINASQNLVNYYTGSSPGIYACGDSSVGGTGNWSTRHESEKQELMKWNICP